MPPHPRLFLGTLFILVLSLAHGSAQLVQSWQRSYAGPLATGFDGGRRVAIDKHGDVLVSGVSSLTFSGGNTFLAKYAGKDGSTVWSHRSSKSEILEQMVVDSKGDVFVAGAQFATSRNSEIYVAKFSGATGTMLWEFLHPGPNGEPDGVRAMTVDRVGNIYIAGDIRLTASSSMNNEVYVAKINGNSGEIIWKEHYNPTEYSEVPDAIALDRDGNVYVGGFGYSNLSGQGGPFLLKFGPNGGKPIWRILEYEFVNSIVKGIVVNSEGDVFTTIGASNNSGGATQKYKGTDGTLLWRTRAGAIGGFGGLQILLDSKENVITIGHTATVTTHEDFYTAKYSSLDGAIIWEKAFDGGRQDVGVIRTDLPSAGQIDVEDNVVVVGVSRSPVNGGEDYYALKYSAADGQVLWQQREGGRYNDSIKGVAIQPGAVVVTGQSDASSSNTDILTIRYTDGSAPLVTDQKAEQSDATSAVLKAKVNPGSWTTTARFEYGLTPELGLTLPEAALGSGALPVVLSAILTDLPPHTTFYYRATATNVVGTTSGPLMSITTPNAVPVARDDEVHSASGSILTIDPLSNDSDSDGDALAITSVADGSHGTTTTDGKTIRYAGGANFNGNDSFTYVVSDGFGGTASGTVVIRNVVPVARDRHLHPPAFATEIVVDIADLVSDGDGDALTLDSVSNGQHGSVTFSGTSLTYVVNPATYQGSDAFQYKITDGAGGSAVGSITFGNVLPSPQADSFQINPGMVSLDVLQNDTDQDGDSLTISSVSGAAYGAVTTDGAEVTFTPLVDFEGADSFTYTVTDGRGGISSAQVLIRAAYAVLRELDSEGSEVPGLPGATWSSFDTPSIFDAGRQAGWLARYRQDGKSFQGIFSGPLGNLSLRLRTGESVTDAAGSRVAAIKFRKFSQPVFSGDSLAFVAKLAGEAVTQRNNEGIWVRSSGELREVARKGAAAPDAPGKRFKHFSEIVMPSPDFLVFTAALQGEERTTHGIWLWNSGSGVRGILREGTIVTLNQRRLRIKSCRLLGPVTGSPGHGRYGSSSLDGVLRFTDGSQGVVRISSEGDVQLVAHSADALSFGSTAESFGIPSAAGNRDQPVFLAKLRSENGKDRGAEIIYDSESDKVLLETGTSAPGTGGALFQRFSNPVAGIGSDGESLVAVQAKLSGSLPPESSGIWTIRSDSEEPVLVARTGSLAPGASDATFQAFESISVVQGRGLLFTARLSPKEGKVRRFPDRGCWAMTDLGDLRMVLREGDIVNGKVLRAFDILGTVRSSARQQRAWAQEDETPTLIYKAYFVDGTQSIVTIALP